MSEVSILRDIPEENLRAGDVATLVDRVDHPHGGEAGAVLEVFNALGESIAVVTVPISAIAPLRAGPSAGRADSIAGRLDSEI